MSFLKNIAIAIVQRAGHPVPMDIQSGKTAKKGSGFLTMLGNLQNRTQNNLQMPTPPTPPLDPTDMEAQRKYNEALLAYNQQFQSYHTGVLQLFNQRFLMMQQAMLQAQQAARQQASQGVSSPLASSGSSLGVGGILGGEVDL